MFLIGDIYLYVELGRLVLKVFSIVSIFYGIYLLAVLYDHRYGTSKDMFRKQTVVLFIAHPDDECMFFGPTLLNLVKADCWIYVICLSSGNYDNLGKQRKEELRQSCKILGIPSGNVIIIQHSRMPDDPDKTWNKCLVGDIISRYVKAISATVVLSFDANGVSKHKNHISVYKALRYLVKHNHLPAESKVYTLETTDLIRKYSAFMGITAGFLAHEVTFLASFHDAIKIRQAMKAHKSQYVWFRKLYILFSRYIYLNTYRELRLPNA